MRGNRQSVPKSRGLEGAVRGVRNRGQAEGGGEEPFRRRAAAAVHRAGADSATGAGVSGRADHGAGRARPARRVEAVGNAEKAGSDDLPDLPTSWTRWKRCATKSAF